IAHARASRSLRQLAGPSPPKTSTPPPRAISTSLLPYLLLPSVGTPRKGRKGCRTIAALLCLVGTEYHRSYNRERRSPQRPPKTPPGTLGPGRDRFSSPGAFLMDRAKPRKGLSALYRSSGVFAARGRVKFGCERDIRSTASSAMRSGIATDGR